MTQYPKWMKPSLVLRLQEDARIVQGIATPQQVREFNTGVYDENVPVVYSGQQIEKWHHEIGDGRFLRFRHNTFQASKFLLRLKREDDYGKPSSWIKGDPPQRGIYVATWIGCPWDNSPYLRYFDGSNWHACGQFNDRMMPSEQSNIKWYRRITRDEAEQFFTFFADC